MTLDHLDETVEVKSWTVGDLRKIQYDQSTTSIYARLGGCVQQSTPFQSPTERGLSIRYTENFPMAGGLSGHVWAQAFTESGHEIDLAIDPAYIFERTGCLISPKISQWGGGSLVSVFNIVSAAVSELTMMLNLSLERFLEHHEIPAKPPTDYLALDHLRDCKVVLAGSTDDLAGIYTKFQSYSTSFWADYERMGRVIRIPANIRIYPTRSLWTANELASLEEGDLLAVQNFRTPTGNVRVRGGIYFKNHKNLKKQFEVFIQMNEEDTNLHFGSDELGIEQATPSEAASLAPLDEIELEIQAGKTTILFNDLCSVQAGTLIELRDHSLPFVKLCVMGSPILEGELVTFQDQVMIQITKRLD